MTKNSNGRCSPARFRGSLSSERRRSRCPASPPPPGTGHCPPGAAATRRAGDAGNAGLANRRDWQERGAGHSPGAEGRGRGAPVGPHPPWRAFSSSELARRFSSSMARRRRRRRGRALRARGGRAGASAHRSPDVPCPSGPTRGPGEPPRRRGRGRRHHWRHRLPARQRRRRRGSCWRWRRPAETSPARRRAPAGAEREDLAARPRGVFAVTASASWPGRCAPSATLCARNALLRARLPRRPASPWARAHWQGRPRRRRLLPPPPPPPARTAAGSPLTASPRVACERSPRPRLRRLRRCAGHYSSQQAPRGEEAARRESVACWEL